MATLASGVKLADGENLVMEIEAELWATSSNPISQLLGGLSRVFSKILGFKKKGYWVITDKRVIEVSTQINCWCITTDRHVKFVLPSSVKEIGYTKTPTCGLFCPVYYLYYESFTQRSAVQLKGTDETGAAKAADAFYAAISHANI
ncbi:MAG: hypothetical protein LBI28_08985 [Treponema sp.]|jgi:hypothetical protein|nr:hypothetical protein [Treponema sp.]